MPLQKLPNDIHGVPAWSTTTFGSMAFQLSFCPGGSSRTRLRDPSSCRRSARRAWRGRCTSGCCRRSRPNSRGGTGRRSTRCPAPRCCAAGTRARAAGTRRACRGTPGLVRPGEEIRRGLGGDAAAGAEVVKLVVRGDDHRIVRVEAAAERERLGRSVRIGDADVAVAGHRGGGGLHHHGRSGVAGIIGVVMLDARHVRRPLADVARSARHVGRAALRRSPRRDSGSTPFVLPPCAGQVAPFAQTFMDTPSDSPPLLPEQPKADKNERSAARRRERAEMDRGASDAL